MAVTQVSGRTLSGIVMVGNVTFEINKNVRGQIVLFLKALHNWMSLRGGDARSSETLRGNWISSIQTKLSRPRVSTPPGDQWRVLSTNR